MKKKKALIISAISILLVAALAGCSGGGDTVAETPPVQNSTPIEDNTPVESTTPVEDNTPEPTPEVTPEPSEEPEPSVEPTPEATPEPSVEPEPVVTLEPTPEPEPSIEPTPEPTPEPSVEPEPVVTPTPEPTPAPEPTPSSSATQVYDLTAQELPEGMTLDDMYLDAGARKRAEEALKETAGKFTYPENYTLVGMTAREIRLGYYIDKTNGIVYDQDGNMTGGIDTRWIVKPEKPKVDLFPEINTTLYAKVTRLVAYKNGTAVRSQVYGYDATGNLTLDYWLDNTGGDFDNKGEKIERTYDSEGRILKYSSTTIYSDGSASEKKTTTYSYERKGNQDLVYVNGKLSSTTTNEYDSKGNVIRTTVTDSDGYKTVTIFAYDSNGLLTERTRQSSYGANTVRYTYNSAGQVLTETSTNPFGDQTATEYTYDANGILAKMKTHVTGYRESVETTTYDKSGNVLEYVHQSLYDTQERKAYTYTYDSAGNLSTESYRNSDASSRNYDYTYTFEKLK